MDEYDEPYHFSPACDPDDIILEGSDAEETPEEILAKRARYEAHAESYRNGSVPFIMTASMKGPFDRASGWDNPWRYRPRNPPKLVEEDDWWKPGSEDMMFTRKNVLKRAADHGLGWMTPAAALEWCRAAASAEVEAGGENSQSMQTYVGSNHRFSHSGSLGGNQLSTGANTQPSQAIYTQGQPPTTGSRQPRQTLYTQGQSTTVGIGQPRRMYIFTDSGPSIVDTKRGEDSFTRGTKRPCDLKWLKGSYSSKRSRWDDGPPIPSPTPLPAIRRSDAASMPMLSTPVHAPRKLALTAQRSSSLQSFTSKTKKRNSLGNKKSTRKPTLESSTQGRIEDGLLSTKSGHFQAQNAHHKVRELEEDNITAVSFCYGSASKLNALEKESNIFNLVSSDFEPDHPIQHGAQGPQTEIPSFPPVSKTDARNISHESPIDHFSLVEECDPLNEVSFVTEFVPSCRDLEKFQFRKKRKLFHQNADSSGLGSSGAKKKTTSLPERRGSAVSSIKVSSLVENLDDNDEEWETTIGIGQTGQIDSYSQPHSKIPKSSSRRSHGSIRSTSSNHFMEYKEDDDDEEWETTNGNREDHIPSDSVLELDDDDHNEDWETTIGERLQPNSAQRDSVVTSSEKEVVMERAALKELLPTMEESITLAKSQYSNSSWDMVDNIASSSFRRAAVTSPNKPQLPKDYPPENQGTPTTPSSVPISESASGIKITALRAVSIPRSTPQSFSSTSKSPRLSSKAIASPIQCNIRSSPLIAITSEISKADETIDQNDISTQSANATPARSLKKPMSPSSRSSRHRVSQKGASFITDEDPTVGSVIREKGLLDVPIKHDRQISQHEAQTEEDEEDEMSQIQLALSQNCPSNSSHVSESSWGHGSHGKPDHDANVVTVTKQSARSQVDDRSSISPLGATQPKPSSMSYDERNMSSNTSPRSVGVITPTPSEFAIVNDVRPRSCTPIIIRENSQASGPQTPWADNDVLPTIVSVAATRSTEAEAITMYKEDNEPKETDWEQFERSLLAQTEKITPLKAFTTPLKSPKAAKIDVNKSSNTEEDTAINPWTSSLRKIGSRKTKKRVSFGFDLAVEESESFRPPTPIIERPPFSQTDPDPLDDGHPPPRPISMIGSSTATQRTFKRILPDKTASQINSSPAPIEAMAEAFIVADQEAPMKRRPSTPLQSRIQSPQLYRRSSWLDEKNDNMGFPDFSPLHETTPVSEFMKDFDIADALGDANAFLEDWSVEADLKKSREAEMRDHESNGMKRRKLFGLI